MNVFVLCTGRSGSKAFFHACKHIKNYTTGHEKNSSKVGKSRLSYPDNHIEIDNRLSWFLGRLDKEYGDDAFYVHLIRDEKGTAKSFNKRWIGKNSIIRAYAEGILKTHPKTLEVCYDYYHTVNSNIKLFLKDKSNVLKIHLEEVDEKFPLFWKAINGEGSLDASLQEFNKQHNASESPILQLIKYSIWSLKNPFN